ncbi:MAG: DUF6515 family protein [Pseudomonadota bacterium]|mgnify:FL=1
MNTHRTVYTSMAIAVLLSGLGATAWADKDKERGRGRGEEVRGSDRVIQVDRAAPGIDRRSNDRVIQLDRTVTGVDRRSSDRVIHVDRPAHNRGVHVDSPYRGRDPRGIVIEGGRRTIPPQVHTQYQQRGWVIDKRYNHNHYYPPRGHVVTALPTRYHTVHYHNVPYYFHAGVWYRSYNSRFVVAIPPIGISVRVLPDIYTTIWVGGAPYYYAGGVYYTWRPEERVYIVANPPTEIANVGGGNDSADQMYIYPKQGQSDQQQATDRYECHRWGTSQTSYDPTAPNQNLSVSEQASKRLDYRRAMKACLDGRGYSVQ